MSKHAVSAIPGDGIGPVGLAETQKVLAEPGELPVSNGSDAPFPLAANGLSKPV